MLRFWLVLFAYMMMPGIVGDDGAGGGDDGDIDDIDDFVIDDEEDDDGGKGDDEGKRPDPEKIDNPPDGGEETLAARLERLEAEAAAREAEQAVIAATNALKEKYEDFDIVKITEALKKMSPEEQERYNNPVGWEAIHLKEFARSDVVDPFDPGRSASKEPFDFDKGYERVRAGDKKAVIDLFEHAK